MGKKHNMSDISRSISLEIADAEETNVNLEETVIVEATEDIDREEISEPEVFEDAEVITCARVRFEPDGQIYTAIPAGTIVKLPHGKSESWTKVILENGFTGYMRTHLLK